MLGHVDFVWQILIEVFGIGEICAQFRGHEQVVEHEPSAVMEHREPSRFGNDVFNRRQHTGQKRGIADK